MSGAGPPAAEQTRARYPDEYGVVERDGVGCTTRSSATGEPTVFLLPTWSIVHSRLWKVQVAYSRAALPRRDVRRPRQRPLDGRPPEATPKRVRRGRARGAGRDRHRAGGARRLLDGGAVVAAARRRHPERVARRRLHRARACRSASARRRAPSIRRRGARHRRGMGQVQPPLLAARLPRLPRVLLPQIFSEPHSTKPIEDCVGWGTRPTAETLVATRDARAGLSTRGDARACAARPVPRASSTATEDGILRSRTASRSPRRRAEARHGRRRRPQPARARPGRVNRLLRDFTSRPAPTAGALDAREGAAPAAGALHLVADRPRSRAARRRDRRRVAHACTRTCRSTGSRSPRSRRCSRPAASASTLRARSSPASRRTSPRESRARPARVPSVPADGRDPRQQLHGLRRRRPRRALRPVDRRRGLGPRLLPAREPGAQARAVRVDDRLRRLAADARRRRRTRPASPPTTTRR